MIMHLFPISKFATNCQMHTKLQKINSNKSNTLKGVSSFEGIVYLKYIKYYPTLKILAWYDIIIGSELYKRRKSYEKVQQGDFDKYFSVYMQYVCLLFCGGCQRQ